jgi:hypothetical protein
MDARIFIKLLEYDKDVPELKDELEGEKPVRDILVPSLFAFRFCCRK